MTITVLDTDTAMREILRAEPADRSELLRRTIEPAAGMYRYFPGEVDLVAMHAMSSGFPLDRDQEVCQEALQTLRDADAWTRIEQALQEGSRCSSQQLRGSPCRISRCSSCSATRPTAISWTPAGV